MCTTSFADKRQKTERKPNSNGKSARRDVHIQLKALTKHVKMSDNINIARDACKHLSGDAIGVEVIISGVENQWHDFWRQQRECEGNPSRVFLDFLKWKELNMSPNVPNTVLIMLLIILILKDINFTGSETARFLEQKKDKYINEYENDPGETFKLLYLLNRFVGKIKNRNKVAFQTMACLLDRIAYEKMSSKKPSMAQCRHLVMIEHIGNIVSVAKVSKNAQSIVKSLKAKKKRPTAREAALQEHLSQGE